VNYLPWIFVGFDIISGDDIAPSLIAILIGHIFYFFKDVFPSKYSIDILRTPAIL